MICDLVMRVKRACREKWTRSRNVGGGSERVLRVQRPEVRTERDVKTKGT